MIAYWCLLSSEVQLLPAFSPAICPSLFLSELSTLLVRLPLVELTLGQSVLGEVNPQRSGWLDRWHCSELATWPCSSCDERYKTSGSTATSTAPSSDRPSCCQRLRRRRYGMSAPRRIRPLLSTRLP
ncbi:hypothetical protein OBBRIDRAFT_455120 [Obba rivulosa]|uniref:Uncharacterized protein n=1 Tax=Obba rivulosa TaxID=1052685 RepID=A0A8E2B5H3_9APHY|nr:hypothetical protein OBBRIDRAFT_455120 [Obba rivulosa]